MYGLSGLNFTAKRRCSLFQREWVAVHDGFCAVGRDTIHANGCSVRRAQMQKSLYGKRGSRSAGLFHSAGLVARIGPTLRCRRRRSASLRAAPERTRWAAPKAKAKSGCLASRSLMLRTLPSPKCGFGLRRGSLASDGGASVVLLNPPRQESVSDRLYLPLGAATLRLFAPPPFQSAGLARRVAGSAGGVSFGRAVQPATCAPTPHAGDSRSAPPVQSGPGRKGASTPSESDSHRASA